MRCLALSLILAASTAATAADAPAWKITRVRGTVERISATKLTIKTDAGAMLSAAITPTSNFAVVEARNFNQIKPTDFVGITAVPGRAGHLNAEEVHVLPVVGLGEGQYPWDHRPSSAQSVSASSMTNGSVATTSAAPRATSSMTNGSVTKTTGARQLTLTYRGAQMVDGKCEGHAVAGNTGCTGTAIVDVSPTTPVVAIVAGKRTDARAGLAVFAAIATDGAGHTLLGSATFEKNGVKPQF
jgi:hypothetical protein